MAARPATMRFSRSASYFARTTSGSNLDMSAPSTSGPEAGGRQIPRLPADDVDAGRLMVDHHRRDPCEMVDDQLISTRGVARFDRIGDLRVRSDDAGP